MKHLLLFCFFFLLCYNVTEAQTYANIPGPENVLVVYKQPVDDQDTIGLVSEAIKNYYVAARNIPAVNVVPLILDTLVDIYDPETQTTHKVGLAQVTDIIRDFYQDSVWG